MDHTVDLKLLQSREWPWSDVWCSWMTSDRPSGDPASTESKWINQYLFVSPSLIANTAKTAYTPWAHTGKAYKEEFHRQLQRNASERSTIIVATKWSLATRTVIASVRTCKIFVVIVIQNVSILLLGMFSLVVLVWN